MPESYQDSGDQQPPYLDCYDTVGGYNLVAAGCTGHGRKVAGASAFGRRDAFDF